MKDNIILKIDNIKKNFGGILAVDGVSLEIKEGEIVSIIGPNGAGKTTVFNILTGVYTTDEGTIVFNGEEIHNKSPIHIVKAGISRTFQNIRLFSDLRVIENVLIGSHLNTKYGIFSSIFRTKKFKNEEDRETIRAIELLKSIGLDYRRDEYAANLPYGEQRKLEIARSLATGAKLILLDEPAAGMNPKESAELMEFIRKIRIMGYTVLMIEHDMSVVMNISDRIYVIDHGKPVANGLPEEIAKNKNVIKLILEKDNIEFSGLIFNNFEKYIEYLNKKFEIENFVDDYKLLENRYIDILYTPIINEYMSSKSIQLLIKDIR